MAHELYSLLRICQLDSGKGTHRGPELVATHIQASMRAFSPACPNRSEFDIYATMQPAKEGGETFTIFSGGPGTSGSGDRGCVGKGCAGCPVYGNRQDADQRPHPGRRPPAEVFGEVNAQLCESNEEGLFVTAWMGVLETPPGTWFMSMRAITRRWCVRQEAASDT